MGVIKVSYSAELETSGRPKYAELREKLGHCQCRICQRVFKEHNDEELDKCTDEMFPIMKRVREPLEVEFHIPDENLSKEEKDALARQMIDEVRKQSKAKSMKILAELKAWQEKRNEP